MAFHSHFSLGTTVGPTFITLLLQIIAMRNSPDKENYIEWQVGSHKISIIIPSSGPDQMEWLGYDIIILLHLFSNNPN